MAMHNHPHAGPDGRIAGSRSARCHPTAVLSPANLAGFALILGLVLFIPAMAQDPHEHHPHQHHAMPSEQDGYVRSQGVYTVPDVQLVDADGAGVPLRSELADPDRPVILNFIFTTCGAICPVMSATFPSREAAWKRFS